MIIYATSREGHDLALPILPSIQINYSQLDITDAAHVEAFAQMIQKAHGNVDVLINNAAAHDADKEYSPEIVKMVLNTNFWGTQRVSLKKVPFSARNYGLSLRQMCQTLMPLLASREHGRIVNVSSTDSSLDKYSQEIQQRFRDPKMTLQALEALVQEYFACVNSGTETQSGWPKSAYAVSKASINALTAVLARTNPGVVVNCCCPGWVDTDMGSIAGSRPPKTPEDGAKIPIRLALKDIGETTGRYWSNPSVADTGDGQVMTW